MSTSPTHPATTPRRSVLAAAAGGLAALAASALGRPAPASAAAGQAVIQGQVNNAGATATTVTSTKAGDGALIGSNSNGTGRGVYGKATATSGINVGVIGTTASGSGRGVFGKATKSTGIAQGVRGEVVSPDGFGVYGRAGTTGGGGAAVRADGGVNHAIIATSDDQEHFALHAANTSILNGLGGAVRAEGGFSRGVWASTVGAAAVYAEANSGNGVQGTSNTGRGVYGTSNGPNPGILASSGSGVGLQAASQTNWALLSTGDARVETDFQVGGNQSVAGYLAVTGNLTKGSGSFRIDHPLDPANKYLLHSFVESPDMLNIYNGNARLDGRGEAVVSLPAWFEALNRDFRYQLTAIGAAAPGLHVAAEVRDGRFVIAGGTAGGHVSWQVTGIRRDAFAEANRIEVEVDKVGDEVGRYLHPIEHGRPATDRIPDKGPVARGLSAD